LRITGEDFNGIFAGLAQGKCDVVISGTTITPDRAALVRFSRPYLEFNQGIAVNRRLTPDLISTAGLRGLTAGIQKGNTSDIVARQLLAQGDIAVIRYYPYHGIGTALDDLEAGNIGLVVKLFPVISWLTRERPDLSVALKTAVPFCTSCAMLDADEPAITSAATINFFTTVPRCNLCLITLL
jgi:polar amino acid transport system substrate-binding protein